MPSIYVSPTFQKVIISTLNKHIYSFARYYCSFNYQTHTMYSIVFSHGRQKKLKQTAEPPAMSHRQDGNTLNNLKNDNLSIKCGTQPYLHVEYPYYGRYS